MAESIEMDQEVAQQLLIEGGTFVFLDVPIGTEFGIDLNSWNTGEKFKGVKMIPPGLHYVYYSAVNVEGDTAPRTGFFHIFQRGEMLIRRWDKYNECITEDGVSEEQVENLKSDLHGLDQYLGVYPYPSWKKWISLTCHITENVLHQLEPDCGCISAVTQLLVEETKFDAPAHSRRQTTEELEESRLPKMYPKPGTELRFSKFPERNFPPDSTPSEITQHSLDSTYSLELMLTRYYSPKDILGELQMAFICFLVAHVYDAFTQWKKLVNLLCSSIVALGKYPDLYMNFITDMHFQTKEIPEDFFTDIVENNNFLVAALRSFFLNLEVSSTVSEELKKKASKFRSHLMKKYKWDLTEEAEDDLPVVVENVP